MIDENTLAERFVEGYMLVSTMDVGMIYVIAKVFFNSITRRGIIFINQRGDEAGDAKTMPRVSLVRMD